MSRVFCVTVNPPASSYRFKDHNRLWRHGGRALLAMYEGLGSQLSEFDVVINEPGINLHPEFVEQLPVFAVFQCFDDPKSSRHLSEPTASAYNRSLVGCIAELDTYRSWGVRNVDWTPIGLRPGTYEPTLTEMDILEGRRDINLLMMADRLSHASSPPENEFGKLIATSGRSDLTLAITARVRRPRSFDRRS